MKKIAVTALIFNSNNEVLAVSRKDDPNDFGLPGGKLEIDDDSLIDALYREVEEETGLRVFNSTEIFRMIDRNGYECITFLSEYKGEISTKEAGVVKWTTFEELKRGQFGDYNAELESTYNNFIEKQKEEKRKDSPHHYSNRVD